MKPTLNQADLNLLKGVFVTKTDLVSMENRQDRKYATKDDLTAMEKRQDRKYVAKDDLTAMEKRQDRKYVAKDDLREFATKNDLRGFATKDDLKSLWQKVEAKFEELEGILAKTFTGIQKRIQVVEKEVGVVPTN